MSPDEEIRALIAKHRSRIAIAAHHYQEIRALIAKHRSRIAIAAHHYQRPEIVKYADSVGDSYRLAVDCAAGQADFIVMCGVLFMAESAAVMADGRQRVFIPDRSAGCPMADMIDERQLSKALDCIREACGSIVFGKRAERRRFPLFI